MITSASENVETLNGIASTKKKVSLKRSNFHYASTKKNRLLLKGLVSTTGNDFHQKQRLCGKN